MFTKMRVLASATGTASIPIRIARLANRETVLMVSCLLLQLLRRKCPVRGELNYHPRSMAISSVLRSRRVVTTRGTSPATVHIRDGRIEGIAGYGDLPEDSEVTDYGDLTVMAGLVDSHVHVNEPDRTEWEGFETATRAAAAGGVTTIVDMPLNSIPPTTT